jgi:hypothetical protein
VRRRGTLTQHGVCLLGNILDLHTGHSAILAPQAPDCNRSHVGSYMCWSSSLGPPDDDQ